MMLRHSLLLLALLPVAARATAPVETCQALWTDPARGGRVIPVLIRMPAGIGARTGKAPAILFSHGLGGSLASGTDWVEAWSAAGFITVNIQHAGSDDMLWKGQRPLRALMTMRGAMNPQQLQARADDVHFVLDRLGAGGHVGACDLGRIDRSEIGMAGHSFGAETTLAVAGGVYAGASGLRDPRIKASIAFSPQPSKGVDDHTAFGGITMPFLTVTGTRDTVGQVTPRERIRPYQAMPQGQAYLLTLDGATHMMLNGQTLPREAMSPAPGMVETADRATILFWRATLLHDRNAAAQLQAFGAQVPSGDTFASK
jgi:predicted dienelactone hydrolase